MILDLGCRALGFTLFGKNGLSNSPAKAVWREATGHWTVMLH